MKTTYKVSDNLYIHSNRGLFDFDIWDILAGICVLIGYPLGFIGSIWLVLLACGMPNSEIFDLFYNIIAFIFAIIWGFFNSGL